MDIFIEESKYTDLEEIAKISVQAWQTAYKNIIDKDYLDNLSIETRLKKFRETYQDYPFIVAKQDNEIVGFCRYNENAEYNNLPNIDCELTILYVKPNLKRKGIGTTLLNYVKKELKNKNKKYMLINCLEKNIIGKNFYLKNGGQEISTCYININDKNYPEISFIFNL